MSILFSITHDDIEYILKNYSEGNDLYKNSYWINDITNDIIYLCEVRGEQLFIHNKFLRNKLPNSLKDKIFRMLKLKAFL